MPDTSPHVLIVGAGIGGLATALRLRAAGLRVTLLERANAPGGKMRQITVGDHVFDGGPSVLTMPWVLDELLAVLGLRTADHLRLVPLSPLCRHFFPDRSVLDLYADDPAAATLDDACARSTDEIRRVIGPSAAAQYRQFRQHAARIYAAVERPFLRSPLPRHPIGLFFSPTHRLRDALGMLRLDAFRSLWQALSACFSDPRLRMLFARYATYSGADPFVAPATLAVIAHVEQAFGVFAVESGMYRIAQFLTDLFLSRGGQLVCSADVDRIELSQNESHAVAVHVAGTRYPADAIVVNSDTAQLYARLLAGSRHATRHGPSVLALPPSLSAHLNLCVATPALPVPLHHHNVFFSADYPHEFRALSTGPTPASDATVYLCNPDVSKPVQRWFCLTNAAPLSPGHPPPDSALVARHVRQNLTDKLAHHGIPLSPPLPAEATVTPQDFEALFPHSAGALYGAAASSRMGAFSRPPNAVPGLPNLFCVGGSTHPGAGVPMVLLSADIVTRLVLSALRRPLPTPSPV